MAEPTDLRLRLRERGYCPIPIDGKRPPFAFEGWQLKTETNADEIRLWAKLWPGAQGTGILTAKVPVIDIDILDPEAAEAAEQLVRERFEERGDIHVRIGLAPKRAIPFRTDKPFAKITANLVAPNGDTKQKIELLANGQQVVVDGIHPDTKKPYHWFGPSIADIDPETLPPITETEARELVNAVVELLLREHGYVRAAERPKTRPNGEGSGGSADWEFLLGNIVAGHELHDSLRDLGAKLIVGGTSPGAAVNLLRASMGISTAPHDERWRERLDDIPRLVQSAAVKLASDPAAQPEIGALPPLSLADWAKRDLPPPDYLMGNWLTTTSKALLSAATGIGKTNFVIAVGMRVSAGINFLHWQERRPARVLYVDGEMSRRLLKQRLAFEEDRLGFRPDSFFALSREDFDDFQPLNTAKGQAWLLAFIKKIGGIDLVIFDNVMSLILGNMSDEEPWAQTMPLVRALTQRSIGQLWVHHTGHDETRGYGTKTREWQLDTVMHLEAIKLAGTDVSFMLKFPKARERTPATRFDFQDVHISLVNDEWRHQLSEHVRAFAITPTAKKFLDALTNVIAGDQAVPMSGGRKAARRDHWEAECVHLGLLDMPKSNSARAMLSKYRRELVAANRVACEGDLTWRL